MALIIKTTGTEAPAGAEKLYRDALVAPGTLLLHDFSNRGTLQNFSMEQGDPLYDLGRDTSIPLGVDNSTSMDYNTEDVSAPELTPGLGFSAENLGLNPSGNTRLLGFNLGLSLLEYLHTEQPNTLLIVWARNPGDRPNPIVTSESSDGGGNGYPVRANFSGAVSLNLSLAGAAGGPIQLAGGLIQYGIEYKGEGNPVLRYVNGQLEGEGEAGHLFGTPSRDLLIGKEGTTDPTGVLYRWLIEDLDVSGRSAEDIVKKDWEYCTGTGEYEGLPTKRPFIDTL